jgi:methyl-accepting chemotaxis protein
MAKIQDTTEKVCDMANGLGLNSSERLQQLQELSRTIGVQAQQVESAYRSMVGELNQVLQSVEEQMRGVESAYQNLAGQFGQALELGNHQMIGYLDRATESQTRFFNEADVSMAEVCAGLQETSTGLMQVAQYLVAAADNLGAHNGSK